MGLFQQIDYSRLVQELDVVSDDQYPAFAPDDPNVLYEAQRVSFKDDLLRCMKPDRPWLLMESCPDAPQHRLPVRLKRPGLHQAEMLQALGHGAEGTCYFQWRKNRGGGEKLHGAVVDHAGHGQTRVFRAVADLGKKLERLGPVLGSAASGKCAVIYDWEVRWSFEAAEGVRSANDAYARVAIEHYSALAAQAVTIDVIDSERALDGYELVVAPQLFLLKPGVAARLRRFVEGGGCLVATYYTGVCDEHSRCWLGGFPGDGLMSLFGLWNEETDYLADGATRAVVVDEGSLAGEYRAANVCALVELRGARAIAHYAEDFYAGTPALTEHRVGSGTAYFHATALGAGFLRRFYGERVGRLAIPRAFPGALPEGVLVQERARDGRKFLFLQNFSEREHELALPDEELVDVLSGAEARGTFRLPPWSSTVLSNRTR
jgi:beta-galactosidase